MGFPHQVALLVPLADRCRREMQRAWDRKRISPSWLAREVAPHSRSRDRRIQGDCRREAASPEVTSNSRTEFPAEARESAARRSRSKRSIFELGSFRQPALFLAAAKHLCSLVHRQFKTRPPETLRANIPPPWRRPSAYPRASGRQSTSPCWRAAHCRSRASPAGSRA